MFHSDICDTTMGWLVIRAVMSELFHVYSSAILVGMPIDGRGNTTKPAYGVGIKVRGFKLAVLYIIRPRDGDFAAASHNDLFGTPRIVGIPARIHCYPDNRQAKSRLKF